MKRLSAIFIAIVCLVGFVPILMMILGYPFIPAQEWADVVATPAHVFGVLVGVIITWFVFANRHDSAQLQGISRFRFVVIFLAIPVLGWLFAFNAALLGFPMAEAALFGRPVEQAYIVERVNPSGSKFCRPSISLEGMPFLFDSLCGTPKSMMDQIEPATMVYAIGRGTKRGVFYSQFRW